MITTIRTELLKIRTTRMFPGLLGLAAALTLLTTVIFSVQPGGCSGSIAIPSALTMYERSLHDPQQPARRPRPW